MTTDGVQYREDVLWVLNQIYFLLDHDSKNPKYRWGTSRKTIFRGCYDVWESAEDGPRYTKLMNDRMEEIRAMGLISSVPGLKPSWPVEWILAEAGREYLHEAYQHFYGCLPPGCV